MSIVNVATHSRPTWPGLRVAAVPLTLVVTTALGALLLIGPLFGPSVPAYAAPEFRFHVAAVAAALDTAWRTRALPISTDQMHPGIEYPYFLFSNPAFYLAGAALTYLLRAPPYLGVAATLGAAFAVGVFGIFCLARRVGMNPYLAIALGLLYAAGPYLSLNLYIRNAFPEYLAWQALPALAVLVDRAVRPAARGWDVLLGAAAFAAPFYLHKLTAPHLALTLGLLGLAAPPLRSGSLARLALVGCIGILFSVPAWSPAYRGLSADQVAALGGDARPHVSNDSAANLLWPYARSSLSDEPAFVFYEGRFALQLGVVPTFGLALALGALLLRPRRALALGLPLTLALFVWNVALVLDLLQVWSLIPGPLRYVQFSFRLIGLAHFLGYLLLIQALAALQPQICSRTSAAGRWLFASGLLVLGVASSATYWQRPPVTDASSVEIRAEILPGMELCTFCRPMVGSNLATGRAISFDRWLEVPPRPIRVGPGPASLLLGATVPPGLFEAADPPLTVRILGLKTTVPDASPDELDRELATLAQRDGSAAPLAGRLDASRATSVPLATPRWTATVLAETTAAGPGPIELRALLDPSVLGVAVECSRATTGDRVRSNVAADRRVCLRVDILATPNEGDAVVAPKEVPPSHRQRLALGRSTIDGRGLAPGHYLLPTFDYAFVRVTAADGTPVPTYSFDGRPVVRHVGGEATYTVWYDFRPELLALAAGLATFALYALAGRIRRVVRYVMMTYRVGVPR